MLHPKAEEAIQRRLKVCFENCYISEGFFEFYSSIPSANKFLEEALKHFNEASYLDLLFTVQTFVNNKIGEKFENFDERKEYSAKLTELFEEEEIRELLSEILSYFSSLPHQYKIYFPLRSVETIHDNILDITYGMYLYEVHNGDGELGAPMDDKPSLSFLKRRKEGDVYLCIEKEGVAVFTFENRMIYSAYSLFKQFIHAGITKGIFRKNYSSSKPRNVSLLGLELENDKILVNDLNSDKLDYVTLNLAPNVIEYISKLEFNPEFLNDFRKIDGIDDSKLMELISGFIKHEILDPENPDTENLLTAIDWSFESRVNPNNTFAFIQLCIALEAILSDNSDSESITKTLADRAAYFIGESVKERREIIDKFKELYSLRSKLVHGRKKNLNDEEEDLYRWGIELLNKIIREEFSLLDE